MDTIVSDERPTPREEAVRIELWVPSGRRAEFTPVIERLDNIVERGLVSEYTVETWDRFVDLVGEVEPARASRPRPTRVVRAVGGDAGRALGGVRRPRGARHRPDGSGTTDAADPAGGHGGVRKRRSRARDRVRGVRRRVPRTTQRARFAGRTRVRAVVGARPNRVVSGPNTVFTVTPPRRQRRLSNGESPSRHDHPGRRV